MVWKSNLYGVVAPTVDWSQDERALNSGVISNSTGTSASSTGSSIGAVTGGGVIGRNMKSSFLTNKRRYVDSSSSSSSLVSSSSSSSLLVHLQYIYLFS